MGSPGLGVTNPAERCPDSRAPAAAGGTRSRPTPTVCTRPRSTPRPVRDGVEGDVFLPAPAGWKVAPERARVTLAKSGDESAVRFQVTPPPSTAAAAAVAPAIEVGGRRYGYREDVIDHPHIPMKVILQPASVRLVPAALTLPQGAIGYVEGSGDTVADDLADLGLPVTLLDDETLRAGDLGRFRAIVVGIRVVSFVVVFLLTVASVDLLDRARARAAVIDRLYKAVFA